MYKITTYKNPVIQLSVSSQQWSTSKTIFPKDCKQFYVQVFERSDNNLFHIYATLFKTDARICGKTVYVTY